MRFFLGTHRPNWLRELDIPLFISHRQLGKLKRLPRAKEGWGLDSGGFTELSLYGRWSFTEANYVAAVRRYRDEIGLLEWAAPMDWMCEPAILRQTRRSISEHQAETVGNFARLRYFASDLPFIPVLQGWTLQDYHNCADLYEEVGFDLAAEPRVGLGSVCRRQSTSEIEIIVTSLASRGYRLHGFGVKTKGLERYGKHLSSADSMAWSFRARRSAPLPGCVGHKNCANCSRFALKWYRRITRLQQSE